MRREQVVMLAFAALSFFPAICSAQTSPWERGLGNITEESSRMYVETLAADSLGGRRAGTPGGTAAARQIVEWLEEIGGVEPFGDDSWYQIFDSTWLREMNFSRLPVPEVRNVIGKIEGTDPDEYIFVGSHYDHVGERVGMDGDDKIFNGADDNASGVAGVLQIARAFAASGEKPQKTVVFAFWDAEEMGLVGSRYFGLTFDGMDRVRTYFNLDMIGRDDNGAPGSVAWFSTDSVQWAGRAREDAAAYGLNVEPVTDPETLGRDFQPMVFMVKRDGRNEVMLPGNSDYLVFQRAGIPIYMASTGLHPDYHGIDDEADRIDYQKLTGISKLVFLTIYRLANPDGDL